MPNPPINNPVEYIGVFLVIIGLIIILAGLGVMQIEKISVPKGIKTLIAGVVLVLIGSLLLAPQAVSGLLSNQGGGTQKTSPTAVTAQQQRILLESDRDSQNGKMDIYVMDQDGKNVKRLTTDPGMDVGAKASPDGKQIVFVSDRSGSNGIYLMNADGSQQRVLYDIPQTEYNPAWSPDGKQIAFVSDFGGSQDVYVMNVDGTGVRQLIANPQNEWGPVWSPDGKQIAFQRGDYEKGQEGDIFTYSVADGSVQQLTHDPAIDVQPAWSPDGQQIVFSSNRLGNFDIFSMNADGGNQQAISRTSYNEAAPAWFPNGQWILFSVQMDVKRLYLIKPDGSQLTQVDFAANAEDPAWMP
jgi:TolB protein